MADSIRDLANQVYEEVGITSDDTEVDIRYIYDLIGNQRALWLRNEYNKTRNIHQALVQDLNCLEMELADPAECCPVDSNCKAVRTKLTLPRPIELYYTDGITRVGPTNKFHKEYNMIPYDRVPWFGHGKFNKSAVYSVYLNDRIYLLSHRDDVDFVEYINVRGMWEDPFEIANYESCDPEKPCWTVDSPYPLARWMWAVHVKPIVVQTVLKKLSVPQDTENDASDEQRQ